MAQASWNLQVLAADPTDNVQDGDAYVNDGTLTASGSRGMRMYDGPASSWVDVTGVAGANFDSFAIYDSSNVEIINDGNTLTITGGDAINGTVSATDTITIDWDITKLSSASGTLTNSDYLGIYDISGVAHQRIALSELPTITSIDSTNDLFPVLDATDSRLKLVAGDNLPGGGGGSGDVPSEFALFAGAGHPSTTNGCAAPALVEYGTNDVDIYVMDFDQTTIEYAQWSVVMPSNWDASTITATFYWTSAAGSAAQTVEWNIQGLSLANDDAIDASWGTAVEVSDSLIATGDLHISSATAAVTISGAGADELVQFRVWRDASNDTLAADARLIAVKVDYGTA